MADLLVDLSPLLAPPTVPDPTLGIGCVGAGFIMADCQLPSYRAAGFHPVAICSRTRARAEAVAARHGVARVHDSLDALLGDPDVDVVDLAVPPDEQAALIEQIVAAPRQPRGILAQKPLGMNLAEARRIVEWCEAAGITLAVNQNMRYDHSVRVAKALLERHLLGAPVLATIDMRAIPHWMPWQERLGWLTLRIMSIHHLDCFRYWFGDPDRVYCSVRPDPRTRFPHTDGIALYILEWDSGLRCSAWDDVWSGPAREGAAEARGIAWRLEGEAGLALGTIGWPDYPDGSPSTIDISLADGGGKWLRPRWEQRWFPDAFSGPMAELLTAVATDGEPALNGRDNLRTMALVEAAYRSAARHEAVSPAEVLAEV
jgi:predicted dehydrogenase